MPELSELGEVAGWLVMAGAATSALAAVVGIVGGIMYWIDRARDRPRLIVHFATAWHSDPARIYIELENLGADAISVMRRGRAVVHHRFGEVSKGEYTWVEDTSGNEVDRHLPPRSARMFDAWVGDVPGFDAAHAMTYRLTVRPTVGRPIVVRCSRGGGATPMGKLEYWRELLRRRRWLRRIEQQFGSRSGEAD